MLTIKNVSAGTPTRELLKNISIKINPGEIHAILGPKQSGKSSLAHLISGHPILNLTEGSIFYKRKNISQLPTESRSKLGIHITFQNPPEIVGLKNLDLMQAILKSRGDTRAEAEIEKDYSVLCAMLELSPNHGDLVIDYDCMSDSEMRKNELLQMLMLNPNLAVIDEIDNTLNEDDLSQVGAVLSSFVDEEKAMIVITNNHSLLDMIVPDFVHVMVNGEIREHGETELYKRIIEDGYSQFSKS